MALLSGVGSSSLKRRLIVVPAETPVLNNVVPLALSSGRHNTPAVAMKGCHDGGLGAN